MLLRYLETAESDFDVLVRLRIEAMRESLEAIGRFNEQRSIERFRSTFVAAETKRIFAEDDLIGFYAVSEKRDHLYLAHLYVSPQYQSLGVGASVLAEIISWSNEVGLPIRLAAIKGSRANNFYRRHGFVVATEDEWDNYYERPIDQKQG